MTNGKRTKYERCVLKVKAKQSAWCARHGYQAYTKDPAGNRCYNPWSICTATVGRPKSKYGKKKSKRRSKRRSKSRKKVKRKIHTGPRGGKYYIRKGRKVYV